jgi:hypothetical protein
VPASAWPTSGRVAPGCACERHINTGNATAIILAWALYLTAIHPEAAERVRLEAAEVYGDREPEAAAGIAYTPTPRPAR